MSDTDDPFRQVLDHNAARLSADPWFSDIAISPYVKDTTEGELVKKLNVAKGRSGKVGACILVQLPTAKVDAPNVPGPEFDLRQGFLVLVHPELNRGTIGTKKSAGAIAREVARLFHQTRTSPLVQTWNARDDAIIPDTSFGTLDAYQIFIEALWRQEPPSRCATPSLVATGTGPITITATCATVGAAIRYTTDGSYPASDNPAATLYTGPVSVATSCTFIAAAEKAGLQQSSIATRTITL